MVAAAAVLPLLNRSHSRNNTQLNVFFFLPPFKIIYKTLRSILSCLQKYLNILMSKWGQHEKRDRQGSPLRELKEAESASGGPAVCEGHVLEQLQADKSSIFPSPSPSGCFLCSSVSERSPAAPLPSGTSASSRRAEAASTAAEVGSPVFKVRVVKNETFQGGINRVLLQYLNIYTF